MKPNRLKRLLRRAGFTVVAVLVVVVAALVWDGLHDETGPADLGLVLGNTVHPDGTPSPRLAARLDRTLDLYQKGMFPRIMVSGALGREGHDEAVVMRDYLVSRGVPAGNVFVDSSGHTTYETALNARSLMRAKRFKSVLVISQYWHVPRARFALKRLGIETVFTAHARHFELRDGYSIPREIAGLVSYWFKDYPGS